jgi:hypothetical protein
VCGGALQQRRVVGDVLEVEDRAAAVGRRALDDQRLRRSTRAEVSEKEASRDRLAAP